MKGNRSAMLSHRSYKSYRSHPLPRPAFALFTLQLSPRRGVRAKKLLDLRSCRDTALAAGLSGFQAGSGGGKTDTLVEGSSLD